MVAHYTAEWDRHDIFLTLICQCVHGEETRRRCTSPDPLRVGRVGHVGPRRLLHGLLVEVVFGQGHGTQGAHPQRRGDADLRQGGLRCGLGARRGRSAAGEDVWAEERRRPVRN